jgi:PAS domain S-box-containing protein
LLFRYVKNRAHSPRTFKRAAKKATIYAFLLALPWGSLAVLYLGSLSQSKELLLATLGIGMAACGTVLLSAIPSAAFSYMSVILLPGALTYFLAGQKDYLLLGTLAVSYWGCLAVLIAKIGRDNREREESELALAERNTQLQLASKSARVGSFSVDFSTSLVKLTPGCAAIYGLPEDTVETSCEDLRKLVHPEDLPRLEALRDQAFLGQEREFIAQSRIVRADDGDVRWLELRSLIFYHPTGKPSQLIGVNIDITERKQTEAALQASEAKFAGILAIAGDAIVSIDTSQRITLFNEAAQRLFGYSRSEMLGQPIDVLIPARFHPRHAQRIAHFAAGPDIARRMAERQEVVGRRKNGDEFPTEASISKLKIGGEWVYTSVLRDITERKRAEERQRVLVAELDHRVKNVLANVSAVVSHTRQDSASVADFAEALDGRIRSLATTQELLSSGRWHGISLSELVRRELAPYATRHNTEINGPEVVLRAEAGQAMAMVIHELTTNATKYGALSTNKGRVSIRWKLRMNGQERPSLVLEWQEISGPPVVATGIASYGTSTICDLIPYEFGGTVDFVMAPDGVRCRLELPADWISNDAQPVSTSIAHANGYQEIDALKQTAPNSRGAKSYRYETKETSARLRVRRHKARAFVKPSPERPETDLALLARVLKAPSSEYREHLESALRAVDTHIVQGEHRLLQHYMLMEKLKDRCDYISAHQLQLNLEMGLRLMRSTRARLLKEWEQDRSLRASEGCEVSDSPA